MENILVQGRVVTPEQLDWIGGLLQANPGWGRYRLSQHIAQQWNWRNAAGQLKDMAARTLLLKLERRGLIQLPARRCGSGNRQAQPPPPEQRWRLAEPVIGGPLPHLLPLRIEKVQAPDQRRLVQQTLSTHHYLGYQRPVGQNLQYLVFDRQDRLLAALVFGAAAWKCAPRDHWIGWNAFTRQARLHEVVNNMRFLLLPWVQVTHLGSHVLAGVARRLGQDWPQKYGHPVYLLESFVERHRFEGTAYQAANWICVGQTQGRSRNDRHRLVQVPCKDVYLHALHRRAGRWWQGGGK
jgi:hypothetical protein